MHKIKIGVIADDFTGASDAASFLVKSGQKTILMTDIPQTFHYDCHCIVIALKIRSVDSKKAIQEVTKAVHFLDGLNTEKIYFKYCSTFDSTPKGNIGVIMDFLLEHYHLPYSLLCPSLPVNGRTVKDGILYVNGVELALSPMKNHPLNPMWASSISELMKDQSKYVCFNIRREDMISGLYRNKISEYSCSNQHFYLVPDYMDDNDARLIAAGFRDLKLFSGGSGLLEFLACEDVQDQTCTQCDHAAMKSLIVCGSCSEMTKKQVDYFKRSNHCYYTIDSEKLIHDEVFIDDVFARVKENQPKTTLVYSDGCEIELKRDDIRFKEKSIRLEKFLSDIAYKAKEEGYNRIIVGGGETSGAVILKLGYSAFYVGESIAPGVPVLIPLENQDMRIILKSGNFGNEDFFIKALEEHHER